jgi:CRISPR-associated endonuclease/helicase Cas3
MKNYLELLGFKTHTEVQTKINNSKNTNKNYLIISPTGSGKTEGIYNLLLNQDEKSLIIQPMRTLATSIYNRLNEYNLKLGFPPWTIQHSSIQEDKFLNNKYCVTTIDQILAGYLGLGKQSFIKGKNIITSNLYFDEVQLFEPNKTFLTTINMLDSIYKDNHQNFSIMTATMPNYLIEFLKNRYDMEVIICEEDSIKNRNVFINYTQEININKIKEYEGKQIIICNTQSQQKKIRDKINDEDRCIILNSRLLNTDRKNIEEKVYEHFGKKSSDNNKILITTQIVEAGIDISADILYSVSAPIDNLIQRAGRCCRWGGIGQFNVFDMKDLIYDESIVNKTIETIKENNNILFNWSIQKQWINDILNPFYEEYINDTSIKVNKANMINNRRDKLIRDVRNINIIVQDTSKGVDKYMFNIESVSIDINNLPRLKNNEFYILERNQIKPINIKDIDIGDTLVMSNKDCIYDDLGFRISEGDTCDSFAYKINKSDSVIEYTDYKNETWLNHSNLTREVYKSKLIKYKYIDYINNNFKYICDIIGLHDLGKLDVEWVNWSGAKEEPLAHFPFTKKVFKHKNRKHNYISAYILKNYIDNILFNVLIQHHGRVVCINDNLYIDEYKLHNRYKDLLKQYGFNQELIRVGEGLRIIPRDILNPSKDSWNIFLLLVGLMMESDIEAINIYHNNLSVAS